MVRIKVLKSIWIKFNKWKIQERTQKKKLQKKLFINPFFTKFDILNKGNALTFAVQFIVNLFMTNV
jgi:hypothetical protein